MNDQKAALPFLARPGYRRRRLIEAIRILPFLGVLVFLMPLLWTTADPDVASRTSSGWIYLFGVWFSLVGLAAWIGRKYNKLTKAEAAEDAQA